MSDYVTNEGLKAALRESVDAIVQALVEMGIRFGEVNGRLDRMDATLVEHGKQLAGGARALAGLNEWVGKADADYRRVLEELAELKRRVEKLEKPAA